MSFARFLCRTQAGPPAQCGEEVAGRIEWDGESDGSNESNEIPEAEVEGQP